MLLFPRDRLFIGLESDRVTLVRLAGHWRPSVIAAETISVPAATESAAIDALERELPAERWRNTRATVVLSDRTVRYFIARIPAGTRSVRELRQAATLRFAEIFVDDPQEWTVDVDLAPLAAGHLGCACRTRLIERLKAVCRIARIPLAGIAPFSVAEFNRNRQQVGHRSGWFVAIGPQTLWTGLKSGTGWLSAQVHPWRDDTLANLPALLTRETLRGGIEPDMGKNIWVSGRPADAGSIAGPDGAELRLLSAPTWRGQSADWTRTFRLALSPVWPTCA